MKLNVFGTVCLLCLPVLAGNARVAAGAKVYVQPMDGFGTYIAGALAKKNVPLTIVSEKDKADYEISGHYDSQKAGVAKMLILGSAQSREEASISITDVKSGEVVFAYSVNKTNAARGKQSAAEACAKHLKNHIEGKN